MAAASQETRVPFHELGLDDRLLKAIARLGWKEPTLIQEKAIPLALEGKDILARARTGSGKTAAYSVPVIQKLLSKQNAAVQEVRALIMAPSRELCQQIYSNIQELTFSCSRDVRCIDVSGQVDLAAQRPLLMEKPDIVIGTPGRILAHIQARNLYLKDSLEMLVVDEADLAFSFGYENDIKEVLKHLPQIYQAFLMSATLTPDVQSLKKIILHNPVTLKLEEPQLPEMDQLTQYHIKCEEEDKFVLMFTLFKLRLIRGKTIIFVNSTDRCYKLKLFLEQFGINSCILNAELPVSSRCHIVTQFNEGRYDIVIASDERDGGDSKNKAGGSKKLKRFKKDREYGVSRGIDFQFVSNVVNFDFPPDVDAYIHRVGRTARGNNQGTALSFISIKEMPLMEEVERTFQVESGDRQSIFKPYEFRMEEIEGFRYRAKDALRVVTRIAIREARLKEIRKELLTSQKLKSYFEDNPKDLQLLRHDRALHTVKQQSHLRNVPDYIVPPTLKYMVQSTRRNKKHSAHKGETGNVQTVSSGSDRHLSRGQKKFRKREANPLKSFKFQGSALSTKKAKT